MPPLATRHRVALAVLLPATAVLYLWGLGASGWANSFYSAAVQAGTQSWKAFFFGSSDAANSITVDKTPASLWVMALSARVFGLSSWSVLVPQALMGVGSVGLLYSAVRRWYGPVAALIAGAVLALTPVAVLMFRFNNPDALLVLCLVAAAYTLVRALEGGRTRWLVAAGALLGLAFLAKTLQALLVVPGFALVYLLAAPVPFARRAWQTAVAAAAMVVSAGWYVVLVEVWPDRPYIGGSQDNSLVELILGYNGFGRITGAETGSVGGGPGRGWGEAGIGRMFDAAQGGQVSWLLPAALILLVASLVLTRRHRAGFLLWGSWLVVTAAVFSFMAGIFHPYYTVALAPAIGALVGMGTVTLWRERHRPAAAIALGLAALVTAGWSFVLLNRTPDYLPWLKWTVLIGGIAAVLALVTTKLRVITLTAALLLLAGPAAYAVTTAATPHAGSLPSAGPESMAGFAGGGPRPGRQRDGRPPGAVMGGPPGGRRAGGEMPGGLLMGSKPSARVVDLLSRDADRYTWVAAAVGSQNASGYQLGTGKPVMPVGGFNGSDPSPTLEQFKEYVAAGRIHYFIGGGFGGMRPNGGSETSSEISQWVQSTFTATTVDGVTLYDLTRGGSA